jgi:RNA polymerase sigma factor (sigma-70 family)
MPGRDDTKFRECVAPHLAASYSLARWLTGNDADAADVLQDASLKAFRYLHTLKSNDAKAWFFQIVRNTSYTLLKRRKVMLDIEDEKELADSNPTAEVLLTENAGAEELRQSLEKLSAPDREILILREFEEMTYEQLAEVLNIPLGTVMSRLARARARLKKELSKEGFEP